MAARLISRKGGPLIPSRRRSRLGSARPSRGAVPGWFAALALLAFGLRALVPLGFEPASGAVGLVLCHQGFPAGFFRHGARQHRVGAPRSTADSHCLFCNSVSPAPANALTALTLRAPLAIATVEVRTQFFRGISRRHTPQARAPPRLV